MCSIRSRTPRNVSKTSNGGHCGFWGPTNEPPKTSEIVSKMLEFFQIPGTSISRDRDRIRWGFSGSQNKMPGLSGPDWTGICLKMAILRIARILKNWRKSRVHMMLQLLQLVFERALDLAPGVPRFHEALIEAQARLSPDQEPR